MKRIVLGAWALGGLAACGDPTQPAVPLIHTGVAAAEQQFTVRRLGSLGGSTSYAYGINEQGEVVGSAALPSGEN